nr:hypothetical protein HmN_000329500 [Hymenolepis microstoma]
MDPLAKFTQHSGWVQAYFDHNRKLAQSFGIKYHFVCAETIGRKVFALVTSFAPQSDQYPVIARPECFIAREIA